MPASYHDLNIAVAALFRRSRARDLALCARSPIVVTELFDATEAAVVEGWPRLRRLRRNGSARDIAGVLSDAGNVLGMMPHPERAIDRAHGGTDGLRLFEAALGVLA